MFILLQDVWQHSYKLVHCWKVNSFVIQIRRKNWSSQLICNMYSNKCIENEIILLQISKLKYSNGIMSLVLNVKPNKNRIKNWFVLTLECVNKPLTDIFDIFIRFREFLVCWKYHRNLNGFSLLCVNQSTRWFLGSLKVGSGFVWFYYLVQTKYFYNPQIHTYRRLSVYRLILFKCHLNTCSLISLPE